MSAYLRKRDVSRGLLNFLQLTLNQGPQLGPGDIFFLCASATDAYYTRLLNEGVPSDHLFTDLPTANAALTTEQGDNLLIFPGDHIQTASCTVSASGARLIGMGGPNQAYQSATLAAGQVRISNVTASVAQILLVTGMSVCMYGLGTFNNAGTSNLSDIKVRGKNFYASRCSFRGGNTASGQLDTDGAGLAVIMDATATGYSNAALFEDCVIGSSGNGVRSKGPGCLKFLGPGANAGFGQHFVRCTFSARVEIATANNVGLIDVSGNGAVDREVLFEQCNFYNFVQNLGTGPTYVVRDACGTTHQLIFHNCSYNYGFTSYSDAATYVSVSAPASSVVGGKGVVT
jgi:hypothetical protein